MKWKQAKTVKTSLVLPYKNSFTSLSIRDGFFFFSVKYLVASVLRECTLRITECPCTIRYFCRILHPYVYTKTMLTNEYRAYKNYRRSKKEIRTKI